MGGRRAQRLDENPWARLSFVSPRPAELRRGGRRLDASCLRPGADLTLCRPPRPCNFGSLARLRLGRQLIASPRLRVGCSFPRRPTSSPTSRSRRSASACLSSGTVGYSSVDPVRWFAGKLTEPAVPILGDKLLYAIEKYPIVIVVGQTGCGKTTRAYLASSLLHLCQSEARIARLLELPR